MRTTKYLFILVIISQLVSCSTEYNSSVSGSKKSNASTVFVSINLNGKCGNEEIKYYFTDYDLFKIDGHTAHYSLLLDSGQHTLTISGTISDNYMKYQTANFGGTQLTAGVTKYEEIKIDSLDYSFHISSKKYYTINITIINERENDGKKGTICLELYEPTGTYHSIEENDLPSNKQCLPVHIKTMN